MQKESLLHVYKITHNVTGRFYIGSSYNTKKRFQQHRSALRKGTHRNKRMQTDNDKYGFDWSFEILFSVQSKDRLPELETIDKLNATNPKVGYNFHGFNDITTEMVERTKRANRISQLKREVNDCIKGLKGLEKHCVKKDGIYSQTSLAGTLECQPTRAVKIIREYPYVRRIEGSPQYWYSNMKSFENFVREKLFFRILEAGKELFELQLAKEMENDEWI